jgi:hypothetical protein
MEGSTMNMWEIIELGFQLYIAIALSVIYTTLRNIHERISEKQTTPL